MIKSLALSIVAGALCMAGYCSAEDNVSQGNYDPFSGRTPIVLEGSDRLITPRSFQPPVLITIVAKTDSTNLRMGYAADQVIFNWECNQNQLRVDGGPAGGHHVYGTGKIPVDQYVTIKWMVTTNRQAIYVNGDLRFDDFGDYSGIDKTISVFPAEGSTVTVKSLTVKPLEK